MTNKDARIYVGNLPPDVRSKELETMFEKYGAIVKVDLKNGAGRGPPFAFIEYEDYRCCKALIYLCIVFMQDDSIIVLIIGTLCL